METLQTAFKVIAWGALGLFIFGAISCLVALITARPDEHDQ